MDGRTAELRWAELPAPLTQDSPQTMRPHLLPALAQNLSAESSEEPGLDAFVLT